MSGVDADPPLPADLDVAAVREALREWYRDGHRSYPWRETTDGYEILVAEVMSQQTQLDRIEAPWSAFLEEWPTPAALAAADRSAVVSLWTSHRLGYNNRARYLHDAANRIVDEYDGDVPTTPEELATLPGVGPYTANAVASFAFNTGNAVVDTNVERVLYRAFDVADDDEAFEAAADALLPDGESRLWNNAIMELGGVACQQTPNCDDAACPWRRWCTAYATGDFTAPDVATQPSFEGSRRQYRGRVVRTLSNNGRQPLDEVGHRVRVDYSPEGEYGRAWLRELLDDLAADGLVTVHDVDGTELVELQE